MPVKLIASVFVMAMLSGCYYVRDDYYPRRRTVVERVERPAPADQEDERSQPPAAKKTEVVERVYVREYTPTVYYSSYDPWCYGYPYSYSSWHFGWGHHYHHYGGWGWGGGCRW